MNMFKSNGGFTLVELIVVIAILAILAGVAVPAYSGYINSANDAAVTTQLAAVKTAAQAAYATIGNVTAIVVTGDGVVTINGSAPSAKVAEDFVEYYGDDAKYENNQLTVTIDWKGTYVEGNTKKGASWDGTEWKAGTT